MEVTALENCKVPDLWQSLRDCPCIQARRTGVTGTTTTALNPWIPVEDTNPHKNIYERF